MPLTPIDEPRINLHDTAPPDEALWKLAGGFDGDHAVGCGLAEEAAQGLLGPGTALVDADGEVGEEALEAVGAAGGRWEEVHAEVDDFGGWQIGADHFWDGGFLYKFYC